MKHASPWLLTLALAQLAHGQCALTFVPVTPVPDAVVSAIVQRANGELVVGGSFTTFGGVSANYLATHTGSTWSQFAGGLNGPVSAMVEMPNGDLVVAGAFTQAGSVAANNMARWNGSTWNPLGNSPPYVITLAALPNGDLVAGGWFVGNLQHIARWDGTTWNTVGAGTLMAVSSIAVRPQGDFVFSSFDTYGTSTQVDWWNGTSVVPIAGQGSSVVLCLRTLPNGDVLAGGSFSSLGNVTTRNLARWNGSAWSAMPVGTSGHVQAIEVLPDGDLLLSGFMDVPAYGTRLARLRNGVATRLDGPVPNYVAWFEPVTQMVTLPSGDVALGGSFTFLGTSAAMNFATLRTTCPATATPFGSGCAGSNGVNNLTATALPWIGSAFASRATGMPNRGFVAMVTGFTPLAIPLDLLFTEAVPGCLGHTTADHVDVLLPTAGVATTQLSIPGNPALVGVAFHQYALPFELDALGNLVAITSSNALTMTIGAF